MFDDDFVNPWTALAMLAVKNFKCRQKLEV